MFRSGFLRMLSAPTAMTGSALRPLFRKRQTVPCVDALGPRRGKNCSAASPLTMCPEIRMTSAPPPPTCGQTARPAPPHPDYKSRCPAFSLYHKSVSSTMRFIFRMTRHPPSLRKGVCAEVPHPSHVVVAKYSTWKLRPLRPEASLWMRGRQKPGIVRPVR